MGEGAGIRSSPYRFGDMFFSVDDFDRMLNDPLTPPFDYHIDGAGREHVDREGFRIFRDDGLDPGVFDVVDRDGIRQRRSMKERG